MDSNESISYEKSTKYQDKVKNSDVYNTIKTAITNLNEFNNSFDEMILLIHKFVEEYDALGMNTKVNIDKFGEEFKDDINELEKINKSSIETSMYFKEAQIKDNEISRENLARAILSKQKSDNASS